ncbi:transcriptional regulator [Streptomyces violaceoruber]|uniref:transcriptional regulator n=1 Tax=Streptomyces TaxID=1883 RepID=UPI0029BB6BD1|nr:MULTISPECIES: transcriptional regulator [unclassified Streptomyces]MDX3368628.1 transcriptional regulator [Streptomyces sp. ME02-6987-2C]MDX3424674.1 transcriptional regulator [Streptomyces sp. ME02-6985-2c]
MARPTGNVRLKAARVAAGFNSQQDLADALSDHAKRMGIRGLSIGARQVRRWESDNPPWPQPDCQRVLVQLLGQSLEALGFTPPWGTDGLRSDPGQRRSVPAVASLGLPGVPGRRTAVSHPAIVGADFHAVTKSHRRLYWSVAPAGLLPAVEAHATLGCALLREAAEPTRSVIATALAETYLLAGRIEFFDLREPGLAHETFLLALQAAGEADAPLLGSAVIAHMAFIPGWVGDRDAARERMTAARTYARRTQASAEFLAWLDAVEAECETRCGDTRTALNLIGHAENVLQDGNGHPSPEWMDWFSPARLAAFKGNTQLLAGHLPQARTTLLEALQAMMPGEEKQRTVVYGDLAAVEAASGHPEEACSYAGQALDQLALTWYATGMDRVREVRRALTPHQHERCVRDLDDRLYDWSTTVSVLSR